MIVHKIKKGACIPMHEYQVSDLFPLQGYELEFISGSSKDESNRMVLIRKWFSVYNSLHTHNDEPKKPVLEVAAIIRHLIIEIRKQ